MGRQIHFYMLPEDRNAFLRHVQESDPVVVIARDSDSAKVQPAVDLDLGPGKTLCLWNRKFLQHLEREWIPDPGYYRVNGAAMPVLDFTPSFTAIWEGKPALGQGRLYGVFEGKPPEFKKWYETLVRWIRNNYQKSPTNMGGYLGPAACDFYKKGGYLLAQFLPPRTKEWVAEIAKQHNRPRTTSRAPKRARAKS